MRKVRVGDVLRLERRPVSVDPTAEYRLIGVYSFGKGIFHRAPQPGAALGDYRFFAVRAGDLVLSNIQAWEGAIALAGREDEGAIGTHRFLTYVPRDGRIDTRWARYFFLSEVGFPLIQSAAPGTVKRNRTLSVDRFEALTIPLPGLDEQRRVADRLDSLLGAADRVARQVRTSAVLATNAGQRAVDEVIGSLGSRGWRKEPLGAVAMVNPRPDPLQDAEVAFVPMSAVDEMTGTIARPEMRPAVQVRSGYKQFREGDVIFARITPCMQNGKCAVVEGLATAQAAGSTEFHVIRSRGDVGPHWIHAVLRSHALRQAARGSFTGTAGQQRVPASFLENVVIPVPPSPTGEAEVLSRLRDIESLSHRIAETRARSQAVAAALRVSLLNHAFAGLL